MGGGSRKEVSDPRSKTSRADVTAPLPSQLNKCLLSVQQRTSPNTRGQMTVMPRGILCGIALLTACGGGSNPVVPSISVAGSWSGIVLASPTVNSFPLTLTLTESGGTVSGSGMIAATPVTVSGTYSNAAGLTATLTSSTRTPITFRAADVRSSTMIGSVTGSAWNGEMATLSR